MLAVGVNAADFLAMDCCIAEKCSPRPAIPVTDGTIAGLNKIEETRKRIDDDSTRSIRRRVCDFRQVDALGQIAGINGCDDIAFVHNLGIAGIGGLRHLRNLLGAPQALSRAARAATMASLE